MDIAVVILNWNGEQMLRRYLPGVVSSVEGFSARHAGEGWNAFVAVADNGSDDASPELLSREFPGVMTIPLGENFGFSGGYNRALEIVEADYYVLLNSDVETPDGWLDGLASFMEENPDAGICQPKIRSILQPGKFEYAGAAGGFIDKFGYTFCRGRILSSVEADRGQYDSDEEVFWASGACLMIRASLYHHLGGLDEAFFAHMEEIDLCWRAKRLGLEVWCAASSSVYHLGGGTLPQSSPRKLYLNFRNNLLLLHKNLPEERRRGTICLRMWLDRCSALVYLLTGRISCFKAVLKAHRDFRRMRGGYDTATGETAKPAGLYKGSILWKWLASGGRITFDKLRF